MHAELTQYWTLLMEKDGKVECTFHELMGQWLSAPLPRPSNWIQRFCPEPNRRTLNYTCRPCTAYWRAQRISATRQHPWREAAGVSLEEFLARPTQEWRAPWPGARKRRVRQMQRWMSKFRPLPRSRKSLCRDRRGRAGHRSCQGSGTACGRIAGSMGEEGFELLSSGHSKSWRKLGQR